HLESHANMIGELKGSPNGKLLVSVVFVDNFLEIFSFDDKSGQVTRCLASIDLGRFEPWMYSVEFTNDSHYLYVSQPGDNYTNYNAIIFRLDLSLIDVSKSPKDNGILLLAKKLDIITIPQSDAKYYFGALKRAPSFYSSDEIVISRPDNSFLSIISNATNAQAKYIESKYSLDHLIGQLGLPQTNVMDIIEHSELGRDTNLCIGDTLSLKFGSERTLWSNGVRGKEITVNTPGWYWAEIKTTCVTFRDSILVTSKNCTSACELACDSIEWIDWIQKTTIMLTGISKSYGSVDLNLDSNTGTINPLFTNLILNSNKYFPKVINRLPTPWMPGIPSITKLIHQVNVNKINSKKDILLLLGNFPNSRRYSTSQLGKLRVLDRNGIKLDLSNVCLVFSDASGSASPIKITNLGNEMLFLVDDISNADGEILVFNNLPDSTFIIEVEHNNENSSSYDGIFLTLGFPKCCKNVTLILDTTSCMPIVFNGLTYNRSGTYKIEDKIQNCIRTTFLNFNLIPSLVLNLPKDTILCTGSTLTLNSPFENTKWSTGQVGKQIVVSNKGKYWATVDSTCGLVSDTINISYKDCKADSCGISLNQSCLPSGQVELSVYDKNGNLVNPQNRNIELFWDIKQGPNNLAYSIINKNPIVLNENIKFSMTSKIYSWKVNDPKTIEYADICQSRIIDNSLSTCLGPCENFKLILSSCNDDYYKNNNLNFPNALCKSICSSDCQFIVGIFDLNGNLLNPAEYDIKWSTGSSGNYVTLMQPYYSTLSVEVKKGDCIWNGRYWKSCNLYKKFGDGSRISERNSITKSELILIYSQSRNIILYDINGNQVPKLRLIAGDISAGVYLVQTKLENGSQNFEKIFIKDE
ncbi:MAG: hypothetical protein ABIO44_14030, partial [Saprospiraceae bacterium]